MLEPYARFLKLLALVGSATAILMSLDYFEREQQNRFEYPILILLSTAGMLMLISAADLIALYLGLELMSLSLYVVAAINRDSVRSTEAGLKYFVLGALSSGMLLYGASLVYGFTGTVSFGGIAKASANGGIGLIFGLVFLFAGFCFKVSAVPFHMWTPDVYEGAPTPITAFFAAAPKVAGIAMFMRVAIDAFPDIVPQWQQIVVFVSIASMVLGAFAAIGQRNIKRLMAYSSIGHMGFALVGLAAGTPEGIQGVLVYMAIYVAMTLGTFACILSMRRDGQMVENISDLAGLARTNPAMAFFLAMLLFSLAGIPPLAGFFAKFYVFLAAIKAGLFALAVIGVLASVVGAYYYLADHQDHVFRRAGQAVRADALSAQGGAGGFGAVQSPVLRLSRPLGRGRERSREIIVLRKMQLDPRASAAGVRLIAHEVLISTNAEALALAGRGERGPLWVTAGRQTGGRGRRGRTWVSERGNLFASLLLTDAAPPEHWPELAFVAALAIHDAVAEVAPALRQQLFIKWPNDLLLAGKKFSGILIEGEAGERGAVVVGIGVNCVSHPADTDYPATDLAAAGAEVTAESLFTMLSAKMLGRLAQWNAGEHFSTIRADWLARAAGRGELLRAAPRRRPGTGRALRGCR